MKDEYLQPPLKPTSDKKAGRPKWAPDCGCGVVVVLLGGLYHTTSSMRLG